MKRYLIFLLFISTNLFSQDKKMVNHGDTLFVVTYTYTTTPDSLYTCIYRERDTVCSWSYFNRIVSTSKDSVQMNKFTTASLPNTANFITPTALVPYTPSTKLSDTAAALRTLIATKQASGTYATGTGTASGTNTGDNAANTTYANDYRLANFIAGTNYLAPNGSAANLTNFPTLNQNTSGTAATVTTNANLTGDVTSVGNATTIGATKVTNAMLAGSIAYGKLSLAGAILNTDLAGSIAYSKLSLAGAILNTDLAGSIDLATKVTGTLPFANNGGASAATSATTGTISVSMTTRIITCTPSGNMTLNATGGTTGQIVTFSFTTSGVSSFTITFGTNFRKTGTLATGTTTARFFTVTFICLDGTTWTELSRTAVQT